MHHPIRKCAVIIGVDNTGNLPRLHASHDASRFNNWAINDGYDTTLLTDESDPVTAGAIFNAINAFVRKQIYDQLIVYFAGHGFLHGPQTEVWLLTDALSNPNEAVNVSLSIRNARNIPVPHVILISDACRSTSPVHRNSGITGSSMFALYPPDSQTNVDRFFATLPGDPAKEIPTADAVNNYKGLFTMSLLEGLSGNVSELVEDYGDSSTSFRVIPSYRLKDYLFETVPVQAAMQDPPFKQVPNAIVESHRPKFFTAVSLPVVRPSISIPRTPGFAPAAGDMDMMDNGGGPVEFEESMDWPAAPHDHIETQDIQVDAAEASDAAQNSAIHEYGLKTELDEARRVLVKPDADESFETRAGFSVEGAIVNRVLSPAFQCDVFENNGKFYIRAHIADRPASVLIVFGNSTGMVLPVIPGYVGNIQFDGEMVVATTYRPAAYTELHREYRVHADRLEERRALAATALHNGIFTVKQRLSDRELVELYGFNNRMDPTLALYAGYGFALHDDPATIVKIHGLTRAMNDLTLFDLSILADQLGTDMMDNVVPFCPMLTPGWSMMDQNELNMIDSSLLEARRFLLPGLWNTFTPQGVSILEQAINSGKLR